MGAGEGTRKGEKVQVGIVFVDEEGSAVVLLDRVESDERILVHKTAFVRIEKQFEIFFVPIRTLFQNTLCHWCTVNTMLMVCING